MSKKEQREAELFRFDCIIYDDVKTIHPASYYFELTNAIFSISTDVKPRLDPFEQQLCVSMLNEVSGVSLNRGVFGSMG